jgi:hypothetical protein
VIKVNIRSRRVAEIFLFFAAPIALRLALLPNHPVPPPGGVDDFSYLLLSDTLAHSRLANPPHIFNRFFETEYVLQEPAYSSQYALGQGLLLALGQRLLGQPWAGVLISEGLFCALCYWMLCGWVERRWAVVGALIVICQFGPLSPWMNNYFGGGIAAAAACLVVGALPRLQKQTRWTHATALGFGLGFAFLARPFESTLLGLSAALFVLFLIPRDRWARLTLFVVIAGVPSAVLFFMHNHAVTGNWLTLPYMLNRYEYGVPATFTFQENPVPHRPLTVEQQLVYEAQVRVHGEGTDTPRRYVSRFVSRLPSYRFFFDPVLYMAVIAFIPALRSKSRQWVLLTVFIFMSGTTFYPHFYPHYIAPLTGLFVLVIVIGLRNLSEWRPWIARGVTIVYVGQFLFLYGIHLYGDEQWMMRTTHFSRYINWGDPQARIKIKKQLQETPGNHLVFIQDPPPQYRFISWMQNGADIDRSRIVWARDLGAAENEQLKRYYPNRVVWLLKTEVQPPKLERAPTNH